MPASRRKVLVVFAILAVAVAIGGLIWSHLNPAPQPAIPIAQGPATQPAPKVARATPRRATSKTPVDAVSQKKETEIRDILDMVGADTGATDTWIKAINDATLASESRKNLIEDLNEAGFADPKNLSESELTLVKSRILLIDGLAPRAMDQTNADAFQEARKDLVDMQKR